MIWDIFRLPGWLLHHRLNRAKPAKPARRARKTRGTAHRKPHTAPRGSTVHQPRRAHSPKPATHAALA